MSLPSETRILDPKTRLTGPSTSGEGSGDWGFIHLHLRLGSCKLRLVYIRGTSDPESRSYRWESRNPLRSCTYTPRRPRGTPTDLRWSADGSTSQSDRSPSDR